MAQCNQSSNISFMTRASKAFAVLTRRTSELRATAFLHVQEFKETWWYGGMRNCWYILSQFFQCCEVLRASWYVLSILMLRGACCTDRSPIIISRVWHK